MPKEILTTIRTGQNEITGMYYARCYSIQSGVIEKWGKTADSALRNLQDCIAPDFRD